MQVQVRQGLENQRAAPVLHRRAGVALRKRREDTLDHTVLRYQIALLRRIQLTQGRGGDHVALQNGD